jgi:ankyrin repeat protein
MTAMGDNEEFFRACRTGKLETIRKLLDKGIDPDARDDNGLTGLIWAGRKGQIESARLLLERGARIDLGDNRGRTALFHATCFDRQEFVAWIARAGASLNPVDCHGWTPLDFALQEYPDGVAVTLGQLGGVTRYRQGKGSEPA